MPNTYDELVSKELAESYCLQRARLRKALETPGSRELEILYRMVAREMAATEPPLLIPYVEITVSPQCTLHCSDCANLMPLYKKPAPMNTDDCISWTRGFLESVDHIMTFRVMGGEPFLQGDLHAFLEFLLHQPKIQHIQVVSNGTLPVPEKCVPFLKDRKCSLWISNYGDRVPDYAKILDQATSRGIRVQTTRDVMQWQDMGGFDIRTRDGEILRTVYRHCAMNCRHIWNGEFHVCPRSAHGKALGLIPVAENDYVPLVGISVEERRKRIRNLYDVPFVTACAYCNASGDREIIPCARQNGAHASQPSAESIPGSLESAVSHVE